MASNIPLHIIDEDGDGDFQDEFDWEAAVREIDKACDDRNFATSSSSHFAPPPTVSHTSKKNASKQSTLNRFIGKVGLRPPEYNRTAESYVGAEAEQVSSVHIDAEAAKAWIYPGKIVFAAPSRPLVMQQIEACHNIVGISQEWTIDMTGQICPTKRAIFWKTKRVFFVTPQVLEKDIQSGTCLSKYIVCLVIDEAHRALGNYSYCVAVRELMSMPVQLRILALTATPGSKQPTIHQIINNICISTLEYRDEHDHDVSPYVHNRKIELIEVPLGQDALEVNNKLLEVIRPYVARLHANGLIQNRDYQTLSPIDLLNSRDKFRQVPPPDLPHIKYGEVEAYFAVLITLYHIRKLLSSHGIRPAYEMLEEKLRQGVYVGNLFSDNYRPFSRTLSKNEDIMNAKLLMQRSLSHGAPSPKLSKLLEVLINHFRMSSSI
ncbi:DEAD/DEAH box RNA helicase family protein, putative isoform 2 [Hibiscus syriacus]|uniref:DEAD/DEAH box RNA helicase family protein, putative isoform 2 n=1 Tax=Hibiscus syriacus TaxID=106335 RepID=A0A6A2ZP04_HIBSY|nr:DEAD/DEAH box RNA helicase family protein, putative isoform 2 [Hibiscus syriacus]